VRVRNEGEFWMSFDDFAKQFSHLDLVHIGMLFYTLSQKSKKISENYAIIQDASITTFTVIFLIQYIYVCNLTYRHPKLVKHSPIFGDILHSIHSYKKMITLYR
jgi:hypothetical protein